MANERGRARIKGKPNGERSYTYVVDQSDQDQQQIAHANGLTHRQLKGELKQTQQQLKALMTEHNDMQYSIENRTDRALQAGWDHGDLKNLENQIHELERQTQQIKHNMMHQRSGTPVDSIPEVQYQPGTVFPSIDHRQPTEYFLKIQADANEMSDALNGKRGEGCPFAFRSMPPSTFLLGFIFAANYIDAYVKTHPEASLGAIAGFVLRNFNA